MKNFSASSKFGTTIDTVNSCPSTKWRSIVFFADSVDTGKQADGSRIRDKKAEWPDSTQQEKMLWLYGAVYCIHGVMQCTWRDTKKTARKRNWGDRNWLCKVKFQFRVHFRQKGGGGRPPERHLAEPEWSWLTRANARTYSTVYTSFISTLFNISVIMLHHRGWEEGGRDSNVSKKQSPRQNRF
jgi:hypothetical protein